MITLMGTDGNNHIDMTGTGAYSAFTGAGNDFVLGDASADEYIAVTGSGIKAIVQPGTAFDVLVINSITEASKIRLTYVNSDLYITSWDSSFAPVDDPNAVIVVGQTQGSNVNAVEVVAAADGLGIVVYNYYNYSSARGTAMSANSASVAEETNQAPPEAFYVGTTESEILAFLQQTAAAYHAQEPVWLG